MAPAKKNEPQTATELMIVNDAPGEECRIAILQDGHLEELYSERVASATNVSNIYKGRVTNVEGAIQAAFIDYGEGVNGFLHISDLHPKYFPKGKERTERVGRKIPRRHRPLIQEALKRGDEVLVQVLKEGIGTKGPTLTSYLSIPGRFLVMMPDMDRIGVSRKIEDEEKRREMRKILDSLDLPDGFGFILRTAGFGQNKTELKRDAAYLQRLWKVMDKRIKTIKAPCELYTESDLLIRTVRDVLRPSIEAIVVDSESADDRAKGFLRVVAPRSAPKVIRYHGQSPIFHAFDIERQIELIHSREVPLPSGGKLVIDQTEALVAIDVNSGKSRAARDSETNAYNTNVEAVDEICRQLRLRDLGGLIINDLIDMRFAKNRKAIEERFTENLKRDRARSTILPISEFGLVEMTRQRMRPSMRKSHFIDCPHCAGHGEIKSPESVAADAARHLGYLLQFDRVQRVEMVCSPRVASVMLSSKRRELVRMEDMTGKKINVRVSDAIAVDRVDYYAYDERNADIDVAKLTPPRTPSIRELEAAEKKAGQTKAEVQPAAVEAKREGTSVPASFADAAKEIELEGAAEDASPQPKSRKSRRRGRGGKSAQQRARAKQSAAAEEAKTDPAPLDQEERAEPERVRVFTLAKELGVKSRDIIARCEGEPDIDVKNHMSSVIGRAVQKIRSWFESDAAPSELKEKQAEKSGVAGQSSTTEAVPDESAETQSVKPARRKRRRRGGRSRAEKSANAGGATSPSDAGAAKDQEKQPKQEIASIAPSQKNGAAKDAVEGEKSAKDRRRGRRRKSQKDHTPGNAKPTPVDSSKPEEIQRSSSSTGPSETSSTSTETLVVAPPRKPRRSLYRSRSKLTPVEMAKRASEKEE